ncbi:hypothetical protein [Niabella ginsengisoli]|uniref:Gylcosyl hydrolase 115 C-terminal domain-containing protein n=1 Tax=Niabella ginsengisoli TaxID=522298 RepID=A0ABS9SI07_9BACT|nr:hypothetical protein [Niabella ginsengisoli]MCH5598013.1 hypothetical protein [Niabella ginsengisoli]
MQSRSDATRERAKVIACADSLQTITAEYNSLLGGKWKGMMSLSNGGGRFALPPMDTVHLLSKPSIGVYAEGAATTDGYNILPVFNKFLPRSYYIDVFNKGQGQLQWTASVSGKWILLDKTASNKSGRINVSIDWSNVPIGENIKGEILVSQTARDTKRILISVFNPADPNRETLKGMFVEDNGYISIDPARFTRKNETKEINFEVMEGLGISDKVVRLGNPFSKNTYYPSLELTSNYVAPVRSDKYPMLLYDFYSFQGGPVDVYTYMVPVFPLNDESGVRYGIMIDDSPVYLPEAGAPYYSTLWIQSILRNTRINKTTHVLKNPGKHTLKIFTAHPGMLLQKIVIDFGGLKRSYTGPDFTLSK